MRESWSEEMSQKLVHWQKEEASLLYALILALVFAGKLLS